MGIILCIGARQKLQYHNEPSNINIFTNCSAKNLICVKNVKKEKLDNIHILSD